MTPLSSTWEQLCTMVWVRWRIRINQLRHGGAIGQAIAAILFASMLMGIVLSFGIGIAIGVGLRFAPEPGYVIAWDGILVAFLFLWFLMTMTDFQRSDAVTMDRILHLPVSTKQAFAINYVSSSIRISLMVFVALVTGLMLGTSLWKGPRILVAIVPIAAYLGALTALTNQLQGWVATIISNPKHRRTVLMMIPLIIIVLSQGPAMISLAISRRMAHVENPKFAPPSPPLPVPPPPVENEASQIPGNADAIASEPPPSEPIANAPPSPPLPRDSELDPHQETEIGSSHLPSPAPPNFQTANERNARLLVAWWLTRVNLWVPPLWMAASVESILDGNLHFVWMTISLAAVMVVSLRMNLRQTLRYYRGTSEAWSTTQGMSPVRSQAQQANDSTTRKKVLLIERSFPFVSQETSAVIAMTLQSMIRAPEVKIFLFIPFFAPFAMLGLSQVLTIADSSIVKALLAYGIVSFGLFMATGLFGNMFGYDRAGFRSFVLSPLPRHRILLGRNIATLLFPLITTGVIATAMAIVFGLPVDKYLSVLILVAAMLPTYCLINNTMAIFAPLPVASGAMQPSQTHFVPMVLIMLLSMLHPINCMMIAWPLGAEFVVHWLIPGAKWVPIGLLLTPLCLLVTVTLYRLILPIQGAWLTRREKEILRVVTSKIE